MDEIPDQTEDRTHGDRHTAEPEYLLSRLRRRLLEGLS
jgi:hypothetical protein